MAEIEERLKGSRPKVVASSAITATVNAAVATLELAKRLDPGVVTILGGVHPTYCYEEIFASTNAVDFVVCGEGEATLRELLAVLEACGDPTQVAGLAFRRNGQTIRTARRPFFDNLDDLPAAMKISRYVTLAMLFAAGFALGRHAGHRRPGLTGVVMTLVGAALILAIMALGG